jgi:ADP-ribose pyrophosphatase YjhB (NUDIX family)
MTLDEHTPAYKVGAVVVKDIDTHPKFLLVKPIGKKLDGNAPWVLPRGTLRAYDAASNMWVDLRDQQTIDAMQGATLEDYDEAIAHELREEAGVEQLDRSKLIPMGIRQYRNAHGKDRPVYWFALEMTEAEARALNPTPEDGAAPAKWVTLETMQSMANRGEARHGYAEICKDILAEMRDTSVSR